MRITARVARAVVVATVSVAGMGGAAADVGATTTAVVEAPHASPSSAATSPAPRPLHLGRLTSHPVAGSPTAQRVEVTVPPVVFESHVRLAAHSVQTSVLLTVPGATARAWLQLRGQRLCPVDLTPGVVTRFDCATVPDGPARIVVSIDGGPRAVKPVEG